jgi:hypothetical protein
MSTTGSSSPLNTPETSLEPGAETMENGGSQLSDKSSLSKIETSFAKSQPVTRSLSSVGKKTTSQSASRLPVPASSLSKSNSMNNKNSLNNKINSNLSNSNLINNNDKSTNNNGKASNSSNIPVKQLANTSLEEISPWLVQDNVIIKKATEKSKIPLLKTVITTEL